MFAARGGFLAQPSTAGDPYWANVKMLITARSGTAVDASTVGAAITTSYTSPGSSVVSTPTKYNPYAIFQQSQGRWSIASNAARAASGQFTFEWWWRSRDTSISSIYEVPWMISPINAATGNIIGQAGSTNSSKWVINSINSVSNIFSDNTVYDQTYHHIAFTRDSNNLMRFFYDGVERTASQQTSSLTFGFNNLMIFGGGGAGDNYSNSYWDDLRLTIGVCRYTASFTPPTTAFPIG